MNVAECNKRGREGIVILILVLLAILFNSSIGVGIGNTFFAKVLLLVLTIVFTSIVNIPARYSF